MCEFACVQLKAFPYFCSCISYSAPALETISYTGKWQSRELYYLPGARIVLPISGVTSACGIIQLLLLSHLTPIKTQVFLMQFILFLCAFCTPPMQQNIFLAFCALNPVTKHAKTKTQR
mmetsp:Transcript_50957/g.75599  ORF Transcript_50957/g.75599 Transcript_50957/m.75599 type:complete len:119 (-) Transcript_50957:435-791(-)